MKVIRSPNESSGFTIYLAVTSFNWPMLKETAAETRINLFAMTLVRPNMSPPYGKTDRPQFRLCTEWFVLFCFALGLTGRSIIF